MNQKEFDEVLLVRLQRITDQLASKGEEYATDEDRLHNFKVAGAMKNETPEKALWGMLVKHLVSVQDMVYALRMIDEAKPGEALEIPNLAMWEEKLGDSINYFALLEILIHERIKLIRAMLPKHEQGGVDDVEHSVQTKAELEQKWIQAERDLKEFQNDMKSDPRPTAKVLEADYGKALSVHLKDGEDYWAYASRVEAALRAYEARTRSVHLFGEKTDS